MITQIVLTSLICFGIFKATKEGNILHFVRVFGEKYLKQWMLKPVFDCLPCMASFWGLVVGFFYAGLSLSIIWVIIASSGLNYIITRLWYEE